MDKDKKIRLLAIGIKWPPEAFIYNLLEGLAKNKIGITIATSINLNRYKIFQDKNFTIIPTFSDIQPRLWRIMQMVKLLFVKVLKYPQRIISFWKETAYSGALIERAYFFLHKLLPIIGQNFDIVHFHWNSTAIKYLPFFELFKTPVVISCRGRQINISPYNPKRKDITKGLLKESFKKADAVHCVSGAIKNEVLKYTNEESKIYVIKPAVNTNFFYPSSKKVLSKTIKIVSVGSLIWRKGYEYALGAIKNLIDKGYNVNFTIIGEGNEKQRILYTIFDLDIAKYVNLLGYKSPEEIRKTLWDSDVFLLSSLSEGISNAVLEAMAVGLPVVTTDCGGMSELVTDGMEGLVVPVRDSEVMAQALQRLCEDSKLINLMGESARKKDLCDFSIEKQVMAFIELYKRLLNRTINL